MQSRKRTIMMAVNRTRRAWLEHTKRIAREIGIPDSYREIISYLSRHPGANQRDVADFCNVTTAAINQTIKDMVAGEYVRKETDEADRRYTCLFLTEKGERISEAVRQRLYASDAVITAAISAEKEEEMIALLDEIYTLIRRDLMSC